ncbi:MAG: chain-length determining protein [Chromatiales bacterium]|nr:chain-length determining protein [Chromatiales bacterium]
MQEIIAQLGAYLRGIWRHRWTVIAIALIGSLSGWAVIARLPDQYEATARVFVDTQSVLKPLLSGLAVDTNPQRKVYLITRTLLSRPNLEKIARMSDLDINVTTPESMETLLDDLSESVKLAGTGRENLYTLSFTDSDPRQAKLVVQSLLTLFVESNLGESREDTDNAQRFIDQEIKEYERRLVEAEERQKEFKRKNFGMLPSQGGGFYQRLGQARGQLEDAKLDLKISQDMVAEVQRQLDGEEPVFGLARPRAKVNDPRVQRLDSRIEALENRIDEMLLRYTEEYPDIVAARETIKTLEGEREKLVAEITGTGGALPSAEELDNNPVYQQLRISFANAQAEVAAKRARVEELERRADELAQLVNDLPQIEAELTQLDRDYELNKRNYDALLARRESARLAEKAETTTDGIRFRVIDPPRVPLDPSAPNRLLLLSATFVASVAFGVLLAFVRSQIRAVFDNRRELEKIAGIPVLGDVTVVWTRPQRARRRLASWAYAASWAMLLILYGGVMALHVMYPNPLKNLIG